MNEARKNFFLTVEKFVFFPACCKYEISSTFCIESRTVPGVSINC